MRARLKIELKAVRTTYMKIPRLLCTPYSGATMERWPHLGRSWFIENAVLAEKIQFSLRASEEIRGRITKTMGGALAYQGKRMRMRSNRQMRSTFSGLGPNAHGIQSRSACSRGSKGAGPFLATASHINRPACRNPVPVEMVMINIS